MCLLSTCTSSLEKGLFRASAHVLIVGVGGVGAYAAEMLVRSGVGEVTLVDADVVSLTNLNRQLLALHSTLGESKVEVLKARLLDINPHLKVHCVNEFLKDERIPQLLDSSRFDYVLCNLADRMR